MFWSERLFYIFCCWGCPPICPTHILPPIVANGSMARDEHDMQSVMVTIIVPIEIVDPLISETHWEECLQIRSIKICVASLSSKKKGTVRKQRLFVGREVYKASFAHAYLAALIVGLYLEAIGARRV